MAIVSDVFAFAAENPDYWTDLLSDTNYPEELSEAEKRGLAAARAHIDGAVVELLHLCGGRFFEKLGKAKARSKKFYETTTVRKRFVELNAPAGTETKLYRLKFELWGDAFSGEAVRLWTSMVVKKREMPQILTNLAGAGVACTVSGYDVSAAPLTLSKDCAFDDLAKQAADEMIQLMGAVR
jgi:hypothetical protein